MGYVCRGRRELQEVSGDSCKAFLTAGANRGLVWERGQTERPTSGGLPSVHKSDRPAGLRVTPVFDEMGVAFHWGPFGMALCPFRVLLFGKRPLRSFATDQSFAIVSVCRTYANLARMGGLKRGQRSLPSVFLGEADSCHC